MFRFQWMRIRNYKKNKLFKKTYPQVALPSDYLIYESFQLDYHKYYLDSRETAVWVKRHIEKYNSLENKKSSTGVVGREELSGTCLRWLATTVRFLVPIITMKVLNGAGNIYLVFHST